jgi:pimeloyl-ACP methyl ester carboxylesterase
VQLNYKQFGNGTPLIILHGLFGSLDNWQTLAKQFAENFSVYIIDVRNHGKSPHTAEHDYISIAEDLKEFMQQQNIDKAHFIGHSMGGKAVMQFSILYPEKVLKQVIVDIAPKKYGRGHDDIFDAIFSLDFNTLQSRNEADEQLQKMIPDFGTRQFILKNLDRTDDGKYAWKFNLETLFREYENVRGGVTSSKPIDVETLVIKGEKSNYVKTDDEANFKILFPKTTIASVSNAGHWVHAENPRELLTLVNRFLIG